jgi:hypothetical protein
VYVLQFVKGNGANGTVSFDTPVPRYISGRYCLMPIDTTMYLTAKGADGASLSQRPFKPGKVAQVAVEAQGVRCTICPDGTVLGLYRRKVADSVVRGAPFCYRRQGT